MRPGVNIIQRDAAPPLALPNQTSVFLIGVTEKGALAPIPATNLTEWQSKLGVRNASTQVMFDSAEFLFKEGARNVITSRVVGPGAIAASVAVVDAGAATVFTAKAKGPGAYGNNLNMVIRANAQDTLIPVGSFRIRIADDAGNILEESPDLIDKAAGLSWMDSASQFITYTDGASTADPAASTYSLTGGTDDIAGISDAQWQAAFDRLTVDLGTGIVVTPGRTTDAGHLQVKAHTDALERAGFLDLPDTPTIATLMTSAANSRGRLIGSFWPWVRVAGLTPGTYRVVPPSVIAAGIAAHNDALGLSPNTPAAGDNGVSKTALGLTQTVTDADHQTLNSGGVNVIKQYFNQFRVMGWRTTSSEATDPRWVNLGNARMYSFIANEARLIGGRFMFKEITPALVSQWLAALGGEIMMPLYVAGSLYGGTPQEAFRIDGSENTPTTAQNRLLLATIVYVDSQFGEEIDISITRQLITEGVS